MKLMLKLFGLLTLTVVASLGFMLYLQYQGFTEQELPVPSEGLTTFEIKSGSNIRQIARQLNEQRLLPTNRLVPADWLLAVQARLSGADTRIKAGEYQLEPGWKPADLLAKFVSGKTLQYQIGIIEGKQFKDVVQAIRQHPNLVQTLSADDYRAIMPLLGGEQTMLPEGWFFPDTYHFPRGTTDKDVLKRSYDAMLDYLNTAWEKRVPHPHIKTPYEALILASIVEKETGIADERPLIARVFLSRLEKGMLLQTDPTVIYGMGEAYDGNIRKKDLQTDTPYNSYTRAGLPPTPIATPSKAAIDAVLHPADSPYLYFVATGKGDRRHFFSETYAEHRKAVAEYLRNEKSARQQDAQ